MSVQSLSQEWLRRQWSLELHHADEQSHRLIWITKGQGTASINCMGRGFGANNAFYLPANTLFSLRILGVCSGYIIDIPVNYTAVMPNTPHHIRLKTVQEQSQITGLIDHIQHEKSRNDKGTARMIGAYAQILGITVDRLAAQNPEKITPTRATRLMDRFSALLALQYTEMKSVADCAQFLNVTPTHLSRVCKACSGVPAATVMSHRVLHEARQHLESGSSSIKDISDSLGFGSAAYFSRAVQKQFGQAPSALRRSKEIHS